MERRPDTDTSLIDLLYGEGDEAARAAAQAQVESDAGLAGELERMRALRGSLAAWREETEPAPAGGLDELMAAARAHARGSQRVAAAAEPPEPVEQRSLLDRITAWFAPLLSHPGLAAAATLVLVAGVAGTLYLTPGGRAAAPTATPHREPAGTAEATRTPAVATAPDRAPLPESAPPSADLELGSQPFTDVGGAAPKEEPARRRVSERKAAKQDTAPAESKAKRRPAPKPTAPADDNRSDS